MDFISYTLIVDDLVFPDGRTSMGNLGGGGPQTLFGYQLATGSSQRAGLVAGVGEDLPPECKAWLEQAGIDLGGLLLRSTPTPRAWQILEQDGRRTEVWRTPFGPQIIAMLRPQFEDLPPSYRTPRSCHLAIHPLDVPQPLLRSLKDATSSRGGLLSVETFTASPRPPTPEQLTALVTAGDIFTPNYREAASLVGPGAPTELADRLVKAGAPMAVVRCGEAGAVVKDGATGEVWQVPAVRDIEVVDVTGCGNTFCGGFSGALDEGLGLGEAMLWGAVAASFMAEAQGVPQRSPSELRPEAFRRLDALRPGARQLAVPRAVRHAALGRAATVARATRHSAAPRSVAAPAALRRSASGAALMR